MRRIELKKITETECEPRQTRRFSRYICRLFTMQFFSLVAREFRPPLFFLSFLSFSLVADWYRRSSAHALSSRRDYDARTKTNLIAFPLYSIRRVREHEYGAYVPSDLRGARIGDVQQPRKMLGGPIRSINTCALNVWELQSDRNLDEPMSLTRLDRFIEPNENNFDNFALLLLVNSQLWQRISFSLTFHMKKIFNLATRH